MSALRGHEPAADRASTCQLSPEGKLLSVVRSDDPLVAISDADAERRLAMTIPNNVSAAERSSRMDRIRALPHAATWPAYSRLLVDPTGRMWVEDYRMTYPAPDGWTAFDPSGRLIGRLVIPAPATGERPPEIISFGVDEILLRRSDGDGAAHLTLYPIVRVSGRSP